MLKRLLLLIFILGICTNIVCANEFVHRESGNYKLHIGLGLKQIKYDDGFQIDTYGGVLGWNQAVLKTGLLDLNVHTDLGFFLGTDTDESKNIQVDDINGALGLSIGNGDGPVQIKVGASLTFDYITDNRNGASTISSAGGKGFAELFLNFQTGNTNSFVGAKYEYTGMISDSLKDSQTYLLMLGTSF